MMSDNKLKAVILDWAGTVIDHGSRAPMGVFVRSFAEFGVDLTVEEARGPMGMAKRDHIAAVMRIPRIEKDWKERHGHKPTEADIDKVYDVFVPMNVAVVTDYATMIDGAVDTLRKLRERGLKIGSTTGYTREIMAPVLPLAAAAGYSPDSLVCAGDLAWGRPTPMMLYRTFLELGVWPAWSAVKVDDTEVGIEEGLNAGCWTVGVALTGNVFGLSKEETNALAPDELMQRSDDAYGRLTRSGAHYVIDSVADIIPVIDEIEGALARGERP
jgi:phosphonoacetaldehyde hydrolase